MNDTRPYLSSGWASLVTVLVVVVGVVALVGSVAYWINGLTHAQANVTVSVQVQQPLAQAWNPQGTDWSSDSVLLPRTALPDGVGLHVAPDSVALTAWDSTLLEQALARVNVLVVGFGIALGSWLLRPVLRCLELGRPFDPGNARRVAGVALVIAAVGLLAPACSALAATVVLSRLDLGDPAGVAASWRLELLPFLVMALVLAVAESFRRGEQMREDVEGLV